MVIISLKKIDFESIQKKLWRALRQDGESKHQKLKEPKTQLIRF